MIRLSAIILKKSMCNYIITKINMVKKRNNLIVIIIKLNTTAHV